MKQPSSFDHKRKRIYTVIFEAETAIGKGFDMLLLILILTSVAVVMLESVPYIREAYGDWLTTAEWFITILFTVEYALRLVAVRHAWNYARSFMGIIDLLSILPTYLSLMFVGPQYLVTFRAIRLVRVFRVLKLTRYLGEAEVLQQAMLASRFKITVFMVTVLSAVTIIGTLMYIVESADSGFTSIPRSIYWAIVTLTTVGYGDIAPQTPLGQFLASLVMVLGYGILAVPTGIVTAELSNASRTANLPTKVCPHCMTEGHLPEARYCYHCGRQIEQV